MRNRPDGTVPEDPIGHLPGFSGALILRTGGRRTACAIASRDADRGAVDAAGRYNIASVTKLVTAVAVCRLVAAGRLSLGDSLDRWIGEPVPFPAGLVQVEHLLAHTSGLPEEGPDPETHDAAGWLGMAAPLQSAPGAVFCYSNVGYGLLGVVLERESGTSYYEVVDDLVLRPAGMAATSFDGPPGVDQGDPFGYAWSTAGDVERLVDALVARRLLPDGLMRRVMDGGVPTGQPGREAGFGMFLERAGGLAVSTTSGAGPSASAWVDVEPTRGYLCIVLSDLPKPAAHDVGAALRERHLLGVATAQSLASSGSWGGLRGSNP